jgi:hypothetical protein
MPYIRHAAVAVAPLQGVRFGPQAGDAVFKVEGGHLGQAKRCSSVMSGARPNWRTLSRKLPPASRWTMPRFERLARLRVQLDLRKMDVLAVNVEDNARRACFDELQQNDLGQMGFSAAFYAGDDIDLFPDPGPRCGNHDRPDCGRGRGDDPYSSWRWQRASRSPVRKMSTSRAGIQPSQSSQRAHRYDGIAVAGHRLADLGQGDLDIAHLIFVEPSS